MSGVQCEFDSQSISCFIRRLELILVIFFMFYRTALNNGLCFEASLPGVRSKSVHVSAFTLGLLKQMFTPEYTAPSWEQNLKLLIPVSWICACGLRRGRSRAWSLLATRSTYTPASCTDHDSISTFDAIAIRLVLGAKTLICGDYCGNKYMYVPKRGQLEVK